MIDRYSGRPLYLQAADLMRERIKKGFYKPGELLPSQKKLGEEFGLGRDAVRRAVVVELQKEGWITSEQGRRARVREIKQSEIIVLGHGDQVTTRIPQETERATLNVEEGVAVLVVMHPTGEKNEYPGDSTTLEVP